MPQGGIEEVEERNCMTKEEQIDLSYVSKRS